tara:strand:- start:512 stop:1381 length:870 start_codon:yes stop_codon:yes gene_type:complete
VTHPGSIIRDLLTGKGCAPVPGCHDALGALLIEQAGFPAVYMSGFSVSASFGKPDIGLLTMTDMVGRAQQIVDATSQPVIADADTGYGGISNIAETIRSFERAGVAAIHLEDQVMPKKCGAMPGKALVPIEEMTLRLKAALAARSSKDFLIFGRTDAMTLTGLDDSIARIQAMEKAGVDAVMVPSLTTVEELRAVANAVDVPVIYLTAETIRPIFSTQELADAGWSMAIYALSLIQMAVAAQKSVLDALRETGTTADMVDRMTRFADVNALLGVDREAAFEADIREATA